MFELKAPRKLLAVAVMGLALSTAACGDDEVVGMEDNSIAGTAIAAGKFSTLVSALEATGLKPTLESGGPFTVFAPTDAAFEALPAGTLDALLADVDALTEVLLYHVVNGEYSAAALEELSSIETLQGQPVVITQGSVVLNGVTVEQGDVLADNGIIHVLNNVVLPYLP